MGRKKTVTHTQPSPSLEKQKLQRAKLLTNGCFDPRTYEFNEAFQPYDGDFFKVHTTYEMMEYLSKHPEVELDAKVVGFDQGRWRHKRIDRNRFFESFQSDVWEKHKFREMDTFAADYSPNAGIGTGANIGQDFQPLLGGPFYKNLYYYQDYIRMHSEAFYAYHNDPIAKAIVQITRDFVMGTGFQVQCDEQSPRGKVAMAAWKAFEEVNNLQLQMDQACEELSTYGEIMIWKLPHNQDKIIYQLRPGDTIPVGLIPRVRLIDPSNIVEIVTYPEDITRPLMYVWLTPTQWQMFQSGLGEGAPQDLKSIQPSLKFIYRTVMADQMMHFKVNAMSNEKRGRSDYFPVFSYLKRLRDVVDYQLIALQKTSAWGIDTEIDGDQTDIDNYISDQASLGTVPPAGSEFVHSTKIKRNYIANQGSSNINSDAFAMALSMIGAGVGIPTAYFGTHLSGGETRASALVATEPVAKKMEKRREVMKRVITKLWDYCMDSAGLKGMQCQVIFPELITHDRSQKLKDIMLAQQNRWISPARAGALAAQELQIADYKYEAELAAMSQQLPEVPLPLTNPAKVAPPQNEPATGASGLTGTDKEGIKADERRTGF
jgi:hypothetical protein